MANPFLAENYLFMQGLICARLNELLPALVVRNVDSMNNVLETELRDTVAFVLWEGDRLRDQARAGASTKITQKFTVMLAVANARQNDEAAINSDAGPLLSKVHAAISGWAPEQALGNSFKRTNGRAPVYSPNAGLYPLTFEIDLTI
jgi:hypothetical protein